MAIVYVGASKTALSALHEAGFTHLGPSEHTGRYIEIHTVNRKWKFINGVIRSEFLAEIEDIPVLTLLPTADSVYLFVSSQREIRESLQRDSTTR